MPSDFSLQAALKPRLRRRYAQDLVGLKMLADHTWAEATDTVTLTSLSAEGGSQSGSITCPKGLLLLVIEELIAELDPTAHQPANFSVMTMR